MHRQHIGTAQSTAQLQKLLMNGNGMTSVPTTASINIPALAQQQQLQHNGSRLAPGGAELNLLPPNSITAQQQPPNGAIYHRTNQSNKLAIVKGLLLLSQEAGS